MCRASALAAATALLLTRSNNDPCIACCDSNALDVHTQLQQPAPLVRGLCQGATCHAAPPTAHAAEHIPSDRYPGCAAQAPACHSEPLVLSKRPGACVRACVCACLFVCVCMCIRACTCTSRGHLLGK